MRPIDLHFLRIFSTLAIVAVGKDIGFGGSVFLNDRLVEGAAGSAVLAFTPR